MRHPAVVGLAALQSALFAAAATAATDQEAPAEPTGWRFAPFAATRGAFEIRLRGLLQVDGRSFPNWNTDEGARDSELELRRSRIGAEMRWGGLGLEVEVDPHDDDEKVKDLNVTFKASKAFGLRAGRAKLPTSPERLRSGARTDFVERSLLATHLAADRDWGFMALGALGKRLSYQAGVFTGDGQSAAARAGTTLAARAAVDLPRRLAFGASFSQGDVMAEPDRSREEARPNGLEGEAAAGFTFFERHYVNGRRRRMGVDGSWGIGGASLKAEVLEVLEERRGQGPLCEGLTCEDLSEEVGLGWSVTGTFVVRGKLKRRAPESAGALELAARYESLAFDDRRPTTPFESLIDRARNIRPAGVRAFSGGASFWPLPWSRVMANVVLERYRDPLTAPEPGRLGTYVTFVVRLQMRLP